jgi:hypothetical protein
MFYLNLKFFRLFNFDFLFRVSDNERSRDFEFRACSSLVYFSFSVSPKVETSHGWRFSARLFLLSFMSPYPLIVRLIEFHLVFASLALLALEAGHSRHSSFS